MPSSIGRVSVLFALLALGCDPSPVPTPSPVALAPLTGQVDTILSLAKGLPFGAAVSSRGLAYVTLHGSMNALSSWDFGSRRFVPSAVITGQVPTNVAFEPSGRFAYVASQFSYRVERVDVSRRALQQQWHTPANDPYQVAVTPDGRRAVATGNAGWLYLFDTRSGRSEGAVEVRAAPNGIAISQDGERAYLTHLRSREIGEVDLMRGTYRTFAQLDDMEGQGIVLSPDGGTLYAVSERADRLYAFDTRTGASLGVASTGRQPFGLALTPDGTELWVTTLTGDLQRYRRSDLSRISVRHLGGRLRRLAFDPRGRGAIIADEEGRVLVLK